MKHSFVKAFLQTFTFAKVAVKYAYIDQFFVDLKFHTNFNFNKIQLWQQ